MPNLKFILSLEKDSLNQMRLELLNINSKKHIKAQDMSLSRVTFDEFCCAMLDLVGTKDGKSNTNLSTEELLSFIRIFSIFYDSVDVDSRGIITFTDFSNFCLRVGRMQFKPSIKRSVTSYTQDLNFSPSFPIGKLCFIPQTRLLYTFDSDTPVVRVFRRDGRFVGRVNPVALLKRSLKLNAMTGSMTYHDKKQYGKEFIRAKNAERELNATKGTVNAMVYIDSTKQWMFASSASYLIWFGTPAGGFKSEEDLTMISYVKSAHPQIGMIYSKALDLVLTWSGEGSDHMFEVWDPHHRALRLRIQRHEKKILSVCEVMLDPLHPLNSHYFASSCIDGKNLMWSTNPISALTHKSSKMLRVADPLVFELRGNVHATRSLVYAPDHELIVGAGFDFEIYVWDPHTRDIVMRLVGHFKPLFAVALVFTPNEKIASIDVCGIIKVWNIDKEQGLFGEQVQTLQLQCPMPLTIFDFSAAFNGGSTIAVLAERLYMLSIEMESIENVRPVPKGMGYCEGNSRLWCITRNAINIANLSDGTVFKRIAFLDQDRVSSEDVIVNNPEHQQKLDDANVTEEEKLDKALNISTYKMSYIDQKDTITAVAVDSLGKKIFLGSMDGRVFIFDSYSFGLLVQLTNESEDPGFLNQGSVAGLYYVDRDELLIAAYSNGAVKILVGCHRTNSQQSAQSILAQSKAPGLTDDGEIDYFSQKYPCSDGGKPPSRPYMLRESDLGIISDNSVMSVAFSESFNVIATGTKGSFVYVYDYINMELLSVLRIPKFDDKSVNLIEIAFVPNAPMLLAIDHIGRVTAWTVKPMKFKWINTWSSYYGITYDEAGANTKWSTRGSMLGGGVQNTTSVSVPVNIQLTCFRAFGWTDPNAEPTAKPITPINSSFSSKPAAPTNVSFMRSGSVMIAESSIAEGSEMSAFNEARLNFNSVTDKVIKEAAEAAARNFEMSASALTGGSVMAGEGRTSFSASPGGKSRPISQRSLKKMNSEKNLNKRALHQTSDQYWTILIGDESGNVMCQNITRLVEASGAAFQPPRTGKYPVYQRIKNKKRAAGEPPPKSAITPEIQNMIAHPVGDFDKKELVQHSRMSNTAKYITGVRKWIAFHGDPIRIIVPVDHTVYEKYKDTGLFPELALANFTSGSSSNTSAPSVSAGKHCSSKTPAAVFTVSEYGAIRLWSWEGVFLGQLKEEELSLHQQALKLAEQPKKREEAVEEDHSFADNVTSSTFITTVVVVEQPKEEHHFHSSNAQTALMMFEPNNDHKPLPIKRRVSVIRKSMYGGGSKKSSEITTRDMSALVLGIHQNWVPCDLSQEGWMFPSVTMKTYDNYTTDATAAQQAESRISRYTMNQFNFFSCIMSWVLPYINRYVDRLNEELNRAEFLSASASNNNFNSSLFITQSSMTLNNRSSPNLRSDSPTKLMIEGPQKGDKRGDDVHPFSPLDVEGGVPFRPSSAKMEKNKFGSTANLLQGLNSLLVRKNTLLAEDFTRPFSPNPNERKSPELVEVAAMDPTAGSPLVGTLKPKASRKTIAFADNTTGTAMAQGGPVVSKTVGGQPASSMSLLSHGVSGASKSALELKPAVSPSKPDKMNDRAAEMEADVQEGAYLKSLSEINITNELEEQALAKKRDKQNLVGLINYIQHNSYFTDELKHNASSSLNFKNMEAVNFSKRKDKVLLDIFEDPDFADLKPQLHNTEQYMSRSKIPKKMVLEEEEQVPSPNGRRNSRRPSSAAAAFRPDEVSSPITRETSRPASPMALDRRASMARLTRPKSAHLIRTVVEKNNLDGQEPTPTAAKLSQRTQSKMDSILGLFDAPSPCLTPFEPECDSPDSPQASSTVKSNGLIRPSSAPTIRPGISQSESYDSSEFDATLLMGSPKEAHHCQSQRVLEIANKFHETIKETSSPHKFAKFDPLHELRMKRKQAAQRKVDNQKKNQNELKEYIDIRTHDFEGVVNVGKELELAQIKLNKQILEQDESTPKLYGPYSSSDIFGYLNLTYQLEHLNKQEIEKLEAHKYNITNDYRDPFSGQLVYASDYLLNNKLIATYPSILQSIRQLVDLNGTKVIGESDLIIMIFQHAFIEAHTRIFLFVRVARMVYTLFQSAVPPREGFSGIKKKEDLSGAAAATLTGTSAASNISPGRRRSAHASSSAEAADESRRKSAVVSRHVIHIGHRYIVKPHPKRGFRKWAIKNKDFRRFVNFFDQWTREANDAMLVCELIEIMQSMVPKLELQYYRLLTSLGPMMNRIEYRVTTELSTEVITRIFENIFEVKIVPG